MKRLSIHVEVQDDDGAHSIVVHGRDAWALRELVYAGNTGCTPLDNPGPRWSGYIFNLRRMGIHVETIHERHGPPFSGSHARYVLRSAVRLLTTVDGDAA